MDAYKAPSNILRLSGITRAMLQPVELLAEERFVSELDPPEQIIVYDKIPRVFTSLSAWPMSTNLKCWVCDSTFSDRPKFVPGLIRDTEDGNIEIAVIGNMCTWNCAARWIDDTYPQHDARRHRAHNNLLSAYFLFTGIHVQRIKPAPCKTDMKKFGGDLTEIEFWKKMRALDPVAGLKDHTPGSVLPERGRSAAATSETKRVPVVLQCLRPGGGRRAWDDAPKSGSIWGLAGVARRNSVDDGASASVSTSASTSASAGALTSASAGATSATSASGASTGASTSASGASTSASGALTGLTVTGLTGLTGTSTGATSASTSALTGATSAPVSALNGASIGSSCVSDALTDGEIDELLSEAWLQSLGLD